jgi:hypothetical protein
VKYTLTMHIDAEDDVDTNDICTAVYDHLEDAPFSFDITDVSEEKEGENPLQSDTCKECGHTRSLHYGLPRIGEDRTGCTGPFLADCESRCAAFVEPA